MKAIVIPEYGAADVLDLREVPAPVPGPEDLLVEVKAAALNRGDLLQRMGLYPQPGPKPEYEIPGLEYAGVVREVGNRVERFQVGDRVMGLLSGGGYAELVSVHERLASPIPGNLDFRQAAALPEACITAHDALDQARMRCGETVLVHAAGSGVGIAGVQIAKALGASVVFGTAGSAEKLTRAAQLGVDVGINYHEADFAEVILEQTQGRGVDIVLDFIGASYLKQNIACLASQGRMVVIGLMGGMRAELNLVAVLQKRLEIRGTVLRTRSLEEKALATRAFERSVLPHIESGRIRPVVDRVFALAEATAAHQLMESNANFGKIVLEV
ncbi:MAG: NADPH2:quinone reductase [Hyphomicrobiaceae bacterium]|jgi:NADPH2:quinone reductase